MRPEIRPTRREDAPRIHRLLAKLGEITGMEGVAGGRFVAQFERALSDPRFCAFVAKGIRGR